VTPNPQPPSFSTDDIAKSGQVKNLNFFSQLFFNLVSELDGTKATALSPAVVAQRKALRAKLAALVKEMGDTMPIETTAALRQVLQVTARNHP
jgi:hypothetical protein